MNALEKGAILVTGGAGFIGSALVWRLNEKGFDDIVVSDFLGTEEKWRNLVPLAFRDYIEADELIARLESDPPCLGEIGTVLHLGACSATTETDAGYLVRNNFEYTKRLASWAFERGARFIYASSAATYGDGANGMDDDIDSLQALRPLNMYGYSKHLFDLYARRKGWFKKIVGLKYFNVYGPNENHKGDMRSLVNKAFGQILETGKVRLFRSDKPEYRDGEQMRDFLYVKDAVDMTLHFAENTSEGGLFNIGSGEANTWLTLTEAIFDALDRKPDIEFIDMPESIREKYQYHTCADITRLLETGYDGKYRPLPDAVADYVQNYLVPGRHLGE